ncbi:hypothetical protein HAX54_023391 [Datura stramonium]|uniref:Uncharacterized protein n=1 Tax=Datura stramonium TaxID=4076 RepID=A0ABS8UW48_DATST|nr:hypothetical protein [Datura stramonium]
MDKLALLGDNISNDLTSFSLRDGQRYSEQPRKCDSVDNNMVKVLMLGYWVLGTKLSSAYLKRLGRRRLGEIGERRRERTWRIRGGRCVITLGKRQRRCDSGYGPWVNDVEEKPRVFMDWRMERQRTRVESKEKRTMGVGEMRRERRQSAPSWEAGAAGRGERRMNR